MPTYERLYCGIDAGSSFERIERRHCVSPQGVTVISVKVEIGVIHLFKSTPSN